MISYAESWSLETTKVPPATVVVMKATATASLGRSTLAGFDIPRGGGSPDTSAVKVSVALPTTSHTQAAFWG